MARLCHYRLGLFFLLLGVLALLSRSMPRRLASIGALLCYAVN
jgi:hypothetical protein